MNDEQYFAVPLDEATIRRLTKRAERSNTSIEEEAGTVLKEFMEIFAAMDIYVEQTREIHESFKEKDNG